MSETIMVALLSLIGTAAGSLAGIISSQRIVKYRLDKLEVKVDKHNNFIERLTIVETKVNNLS